MIGDRIRELRERVGYSQAELARKLSVTRSSVNAWESGLSAPTAVYIVELSKLFHVTADYLLELNTSTTLNLSELSEEELHLIYEILDYFKKHSD